MLLVCSAPIHSIHSKVCNKKYKTEKGLLKHFNIVHKDKSRKMDNFVSYYTKYVKKVIAPSTSSSIPVPSSAPKSSAVKHSPLELKVNLLMTQNKILSMKLSDIEKRVKTMERQTKKYCIVCWEHESNYAFVPCGHKIVCGTCAVSVLSGTKKCPVCSQTVYDLLQVWDAGRDNSEE